MKTILLGHSVSGLPIQAYEWGSSFKTHILIIGGVHGNEMEGVHLSHALLGDFQKEFPYSLRVTLIPMLNIDGALQGKRVNENQVDLNRNLPTKDWTDQFDQQKYYPGIKPNSEPENQALIKYIESQPPQLIISLHSWKPMLNVNGDCSPEAEVISKHTGYAITEDIGYPTPGSLGTYCGLERKIPTITYEIERGLSFQKILDIHLPACKQALRSSETRAK